MLSFKIEQQKTNFFLHKKKNCKLIKKIAENHTRFKWIFCADFLFEKVVNFNEKKEKLVNGERERETIKSIELPFTVVH